MNTTWPLSVVAQAARLNPRALRQWFDTDVLNFRATDKRSPGTGCPVGLSRNRAYQAAIVAHLNRHGLPPSKAARAALEFSDNGNAGRAVGEVYSVGKTILVIGPDSAIVKNVFSDTSFSEGERRGSHDRR